MDYHRSPFTFALVAVVLILSWHSQSASAQPRLACPCHHRKTCSCPEVNVQQVIRQIASLSGNEFLKKTLLPALLQLLNNATIVPNKCSLDDHGRGNFCVIDFSKLIPLVPVSQYVSCECPQSCPGRCDGNSTYSSSLD